MQGFHKWKRNVNHIWQLLLYTRRAFYKVEAGGAVLNTEAGRLWEGDRQAFQQRAASCVTDWREQLYLKPVTAVQSRGTAATLCFCTTAC